MGKKDRDAVNRGMEDILGETDILANVVSRDRERFGRADGETENNLQDTQITQPDNNTSNTVIQQYDNNTLLQPDTQTGIQTDSAAILQVATQPLKTKKRKLAGSVEHSTEINFSERAERAAQMTTGSTTTITLRIPIQMNEWLDEYVHRAWPKKVKKQDLVIEALQMLIARRVAAGETPTSTKLLLEDSEPHD